jgi:glycogen operon protein
MLAYCLKGESEYDNDLYVMINAFWEDLDFEIQEGTGWKRVVDTSLPGLEDILEVGQEKPIESTQYRVKARSVVVLIK